MEEKRLESQVSFWWPSLHSSIKKHQEAPSWGLKVVTAVLMKMMVISAQRPAFPQPPPLTGQLIHWLENYVLSLQFHNSTPKGYIKHNSEKKPYLSAQFLRTCRERWVMLVISSSDKESFPFFQLSRTENKYINSIPVKQHQKSSTFTVYCFLGSIILF